MRPGRGPMALSSKRRKGPGCADAASRCLLSDLSHPSMTMISNGTTKSSTASTASGKASPHSNVIEARLRDERALRAAASKGQINPNSGPISNRQRTAGAAASAEFAAQRHNAQEAAFLTSADDRDRVLLTSVHSS